MNRQGPHEGEESLQSERTEELGLRTAPRATALLEPIDTDLLN